MTLQFSPDCKPFEAMRRLLGTWLSAKAGLLRIAALTLLLPGIGSKDGQASDWDVGDNDEPFSIAEFALNEGTWLSVDVSPDGRLLTFDLLGDIYIMPSTGGEAQLIHGGPAMARSPNFSPDGQRLLYLSDASGGDNVWISSLDGSGARQFSGVQADVLSNPRWDPDGQAFAAVRLSSDYRDLHTSELRLFHLAGGQGEMLVPSPGEYANIGEPEFSPDGRYLYYSQKVGGPAEVGDIYFNANYLLHAIMRRDRVTGETIELVKGLGGATTPRASPDGLTIAFIRRVRDKTVLFTYDTRSGAQQPVYDRLDRDLQGEWIAQGAYFPSYDWFPDSRHIAIWGKGKIYRVDTLSGEAAEIPFTVTVRQRVTRTTRFDVPLGGDHIEVRAIPHLAIAPGQKRIVFNALGRLWNKTLPDGEPRRLTDSSAFEFEPVFSPDGRTLAYVEWDDESGSALKLLAFADGSARTLVSSRFVIRQPAFSPDGSLLVYQLEVGNACMSGPGKGPGTDGGLYLVAVDGGEAVRVAPPAWSPMFSPDGERLFFTIEEYSDGSVVSQLQSVDLDGNDQRDHAIARGSDRHELRPSPNLEWLAFKEYQQYYVTPLTDAGGPMSVSAGEASAAPVVTLTELGGYGLEWAPDSSALYWLLGDHLNRATTGQFTVDPLPAIGLTVESDVPKGALALTGGRLITMAGVPIEKGTVLIEGDRITAVGASDEIRVPSEAEVIDVSGKTVLPGFIDMHGHLEDCYYDATGAMPQKQSSHYAALAFGITGNFDPYTTEIPSLSMSEMRDAGVMVGPRTFSVGHVLYGRPGKFDPVYVPIASLNDARNVMERKTALGTHWIKSYRQPLRRQRQQIVRAAREAGLLVALEGEGHYYNNISGILDGHNTIEHNLPLATYYDDVVQLFAHSGTAITPTLVATFGEFLGENYIYQNDPDWRDPRIERFVPRVNSGYSPVDTPYGAPLHVRAMTGFHADDELWDIGFRSVARSIRKLDDAGVLVNVGSHGQVYGMAFHWELQLLAEGGMSNERILRAATLNGATTLGVARHIGSLEPGKLADLVVLDEDPLLDIRNTLALRYTIINGRVYDPYTMNEVVRREKTRSKFYWE